MGEVAVTIARWLLKLTFFIATALAILVILGITTSYLVVGFNTTILAEIFGIIQIWLPFNLNVILIWLTISATAYIGYRLALMGFNLFNAYIGK